MDRIQALGALRYEDYRYITVSSFLWYAIRWIETIVLSWLVLERTNSPFQVGLVGGLRFAGVLFTPLAGLIADRISRRNVLLYSQALCVLLIGTLLGLFLSDSLEVWHVMVITFARSVNYAMDYPVRTALVVDLVAPEEQLNALSLNRAATDMTAAFGPIAGGILIVVMGYDGAFWLIIILSIISLFVLLLMRNSPVPGIKAGEKMWKSFRQGIELCRRDSAIMGVLGLALLANMFGFPLVQSLLPVFAKQVLHVGPVQLGLLAGALGAGAFVGSLWMAWEGSRFKRRTLLWGSFLLWFIVIAVFGLIPSMWICMFLLLLVGIGQAVAMITTTAFLLSQVAPEMRGRMMGIRGLAIIPLFFGSPIGGALTGWLGAPAALVIFGVTGTLLVFVIWLRVPSLRR